MKNSLMLAVVSLLVLAATGITQDLGTPDTVRIEAGTIEVGQSAPISVSIVNDRPLSTYSFGFILESFDSGFARVDSVVFRNRMADPTVLSFRIVKHDNTVDGVSPDTLAMYACIGYPLAYMLPEGSDACFDIFLTGMTPGVMTIDSGFYPPGAFFLLIPENLDGWFTPEFVPGVITITEGLQPPSLEVSDEVQQVTAGVEVTLDVAADEGTGGPVTLEIASLVDYDGTGRHPVNDPYLTPGNPAEFHWQSTMADVGIWQATLKATDSSGRGAEQKVVIQVVTGGEFLVSFDQLLSDVSAVARTFTHGDFDQDGLAEVFLCGYGVPSLSLYDVDPGGALTQAYSVADAVLRKGLEIGYLNSDDYLDALVARFKHGSSFRFVLMRGTGDNGFVEQDDNSDLPWFRANRLGEFTGDQFFDYVAANTTSIYLFKGHGSAHFDRIREFTTSRRILALNSADINNDGFDDLLAGTEESLDIYLNTGSPGFTLVNSYVQPHRALDVEVTNSGSDFNGDNLYDLCVPTPSLGGLTSSIIIYLGNGDGSFEQVVVKEVRGQVLANSAGDFNNDAILDIAYINASDRYVGILFGDGDGTFTNELRYDMSDYAPVQLVCFDVDLDGDLDIVVNATLDFIEQNASVVLTNGLNPTGFFAVSFEIIGEDNAEIELTSESGKTINRIKKSVSSGSYYRRSTNRNDRIDDHVTVNVVENGAYVLSVRPKPNLPASTLFNLEFTVDEERYRLAQNAPMRGSGYGFTVYPAGGSPVQPTPGKFITDNPPSFQWPGTGTFDFELATDITFAEVVIAETVSSNCYTPESALPVQDTAIFYWRVKEVGTDDLGQVYPVNIYLSDPTGGGDDPELIPSDYSLEQNYPNPFNPVTTISFYLKTRTEYSLVIYNVVGQEVARYSGIGNEGLNTIEWNGSGCASGMYLYRLETSAYADSKKMLLLK